MLNPLTAQPSNTTSTLFPLSTTTVNNASLANASQQQQPSIAVSFTAHPFQYIQQCFDQNSPNYRFRAYFYNPVEGGIEKNPLQRPENVSERLWAQAVNDSPDPSR